MVSRLGGYVCVAIGAMIACSGTGSPDAGADSGDVDSGPADSGAMDAGSTGPYSCNGIASCLESLTVTGAAVIVQAQQCEEMGTAAAQAVFAPAAECLDGDGCGSVSDSMICVAAAIAPPSADGGTDGGICWPTWSHCLAQGESCGAILMCLEPFQPPTPAQVTGCLSIGTSTASALANALTSCTRGTCLPDAGATCPQTANADGGACNAEFIACMNDTSGSSP